MPAAAAAPDELYVASIQKYRKHCYHGFTRANESRNTSVTQIQGTVDSR